MKIEMVIINKKEVVKKDFDVIDKNEVISFNLSNFTLAVRKEDLKKLM